MGMQIVRKLVCDDCSREDVRPQLLSARDHMSGAKKEGWAVIIVKTKGSSYQITVCPCCAVVREKAAERERAKAAAKLAAEQAVEKEKQVAGKVTGQDAEKGTGQNTGKAAKKKTEKSGEKTQSKKVTQITKATK